jgi:hypothetical protein
MPVLAEFPAGDNANAEPVDVFEIAKTYFGGMVKLSKQASLERFLSVKLKSLEPILQLLRPLFAFLAFPVWLSQ